MCNASCVIFGATSLTKEEVEGKKIIEVGSFDVNGSLRPIIELWKPASYIGVDIQAGPGVDVVCRAETIVDAFGKESFDVVISTELLEHVREWRTVVSNIKHICRGNGILVITAPSRGFHYHGYPYDFWRYELADMEYIFSDCVIERLEKDRLAPGVFMRARKPKDFVDRELADYALHSIIVNRRVREIDEKSLQNFQRKYRRRQFFKRLERRMKGFISRRGTMVREEKT